MDLRLDGRVALRPRPREGRQVDGVQMAVLAAARHRAKSPPLGLLGRDVGGVDRLLRRRPPAVACVKIDQ